jgi:very-short-patch-repair endonuclease
MLPSNGRVRGASHELVSAARNLRVEQTPAEQRLWNELRSRKLDGFKFRRQYPVGRHILDFVCVERKLVVELDGNHHDTGDQHRYDRERSEHLEHFGYRLLRFPNRAVLDDLENVLQKIRKSLDDTTGIRPEL